MNSGRSPQDRLRPVWVWALGAVPLSWCLVGLDDHGWLDAGIVGAVVALVVGGLTFSVRRGVAAATAGLVVMIVARVFSPVLIWYLAVALTVLAAAGLGLLPFHRPPGAARRSPGPSGVFLFLVTVVSVLFVATRGTSIPSLVLGPSVITFAVAVAAPGTWSRVERATRTFTTSIRPVIADVEWLIRAVVVSLRKAVAWLAGGPLLAVAFVPMVALPWVVGRIVRSDPLRAPHVAGSRWVAREARSVERAGHGWIADPASRSSVVRARLARAVPMIVVTLGIVLGLQNVAWFVWQRAEARVSIAIGAPTASPGPGEPRRPETASDEMVRQPWYQTYEAGYQIALGESVVSQFAGTEMADVSNRYITIRDGVRRSWRPPTSCPRPIRVWAFGGSAMFGLGQRDGHTPASELARRAWRDGVAIEILNFAVPGDVGWNEQRRMERALADGRPEPDLVIFYDGYNDLRAADWASMAGHRIDGELLSLHDRDLTPLLARMQVRRGAHGREYVAEAVDINARPADEPAVRDAAVFQFSHAYAARRSILERRGIATITFVQPWVATRNRLRPGDFPTTDIMQARAAEFRRRVPRGVVDIGDALDASPLAHYTDDVHTNESANLPIAERMWEELAPLVADIRSSDGSPGC